MSNTQLAAAKELIRAKRYEDARKLLKTVDHPVATEWLARLDLIAPKRRYTPKKALIFLLFLLVMVGVVVAVFFITVNKIPPIPVPPFP